MNAMSNRMLTRVVAGVGACVVASAAGLCYLAPERTWTWLLVMSTVPLVWAILRTVRRRAAADCSSAEERKLLQSLAMAGSLLTVMLVVVGMSHLGWGARSAAELSQRSWGFFLGAVVMVFGNAVPKQTGSPQKQAALRGFGWALVLGGMGYAASWLFIPLPYANLAAMLVLAFGLLVGTIRVAWFCIGRRSMTPPPSG